MIYLQIIMSKKRLISRIEVIKKNVTVQNPAAQRIVQSFYIGRANERKNSRNQKHIEQQYFRR